MLPRVLPRSPGRYPSLYAVQQYTEDVPSVPFDAPPRALPGVRRPYLSKKFTHPPRDGPFSPRYDAPAPSHGRVLLLAYAVPLITPAGERLPGPGYILEGRLAHLDRHRALPAGERLPGPMAVTASGAPGRSTSSDRPTLEGPREKILVTDSLA